MADGSQNMLLRLPGGRTLGFDLYGDRQAYPLLFLHGTPGSRRKFSIGDEAARRLGLCLIAPDRWGYGMSQVPSAPSLAEFAADMAALMDSLGYRRFAVGGISGGSPYAVATTALLQPRVSALALVSPMGPIADMTDKGALSPFHRFCFGILPGWPGVIAAAFGVFRSSLRHAPGLAARIATARSGRSDRDLIARAEIGDRLLGSFREGLRPGMRGPVTDLRLFSRPWEIDLATINVPARLWIGTKDTAVPLAAARRLAQQIAGCTLTELSGEGHLWVAAHYEHVLRWIAETARAETPASTASDAGTHGDTLRLMPRS